MALDAPMVSPQTELTHVIETADASCIKCGFCLPKCPTYRETGLESASPRGRIHLMKLVAMGRLQPADIEAQLDLCLGCRACETACPAGSSSGDFSRLGASKHGGRNI
jgi:glycolate oxidase iron-sulfur subunit